jgi:hypothetical protein
MIGAEVLQATRCRSFKGESVAVDPMGRETLSD